MPMRPPPEVARLREAEAMDWRWAFERLHRAGTMSAQRGSLERARTLIHEDPAGVDLDRLAKAACLSRFHFLRMFRNEFGVTPHRYVIALRMQRAQTLLLEGASVTETCFAVGYQSLGSFSSAFQQHVGHPPSQYRRRIFPSAALERIPAIPACFLVHFAPASCALWAR